MKNDDFIPTKITNSVELEFRKLFNHNNFNQTNTIFKLANLYRKLADIQQQINKASLIENNKSFTSDLFEKEKILFKEKENIKPFNKYMKFFTKLVLEDDYFINLLIFEKCFLNFKKDRINKLKDERAVQTLQLNKKYAAFKDLEAKYVISNEENIDHENYNNLKNELDALDFKIKTIDNEIEDYDLTIDKFWDEMFLIIDWNDENWKKDENILTIQEKLIERYLDSLKKGFAVHILRGRPLKLESKCLEIVFEKLKSNNIFVLSEF